MRASEVRWDCPRGGGGRAGRLGRRERWEEFGIDGNNARPAADLSGWPAAQFVEAWWGSRSIDGGVDVECGMLTWARRRLRAAGLYHIWLMPKVCNTRLAQSSRTMDERKVHEFLVGRIECLNADGLSDRTCRKVLVFSRSKKI
jgi:hypothetical protein